MIIPDISHHISGGVYAKRMALSDGDTAITHKHVYDHMSILAAGRAVVTVEGKEVEYAEHSVIEIKAGLSHSIKAVGDVVWYCLHAVPAEFVPEDEIDLILSDEFTGRGD